MMRILQCERGQLGSLADDVFVNCKCLVSLRFIFCRHKIHMLKVFLNFESKISDQLLIA